MIVWKKYRLKDICSYIGSGTTPKSSNSKYYDNGIYNWVNTGDLNNGIVSNSKQQITDSALKDFPTLRFYPKGTIIEAMYGATIGKVGMLDMNATVNQACCAMIVDRNKAIPNFVLYYLLYYKPQLLKESFGGTQPNVNQFKVSNIAISIPSREEQQRIVTYLDTKLSEIDHQVSILTSKRDAYLRLKKSIINHAVTRGLDSNVKMKDSGIEWIGQIPEHWRRMRLKDIAYLYSGLTGKSGDDFRCDNTNITKPYVPFTSILNNFKINSTDFPRVIMSDNETQNQVIVNDLLFLMSSEDYDSIAKSAVVNENLGEVYLNSFCRGLRFTSKDIFANFVNYQIQATNYRDALRFEARGFTRINIKIEKISSMFVCLPPLTEQRAIATYLDDKCSKIETIVSNLDKQISRYGDLKRSLIDEVITGKRAV